jgi:uncharacterized protein DUF3455
MMRSLGFVSLLAAGIAAAVVLPAHAGPSPPDVPGQIQVPAGNKLFLVGHAVGVQIYACHADAGGYSWVLVAPRANLYDERAKLIATHFAGPTWRARDGSEVKGRRVDSVTVDPTAIPWLLLEAASTTAGADGDRLTDTMFVQRISTTGGLAPDAAACAEATVGTVREVPYTADYEFWKARSD